ncbi:hypothetical protein PA99_5391 [Pseudomonas aeruginosa PA99]|nr:hypothetical protein PA99_5391 [Pseudomonas aeruginosa PA99]
MIAESRARSSPVRLIRSCPGSAERYPTGPKPDGSSGALRHVAAGSQAEGLHRGA